MSPDYALTLYLDDRGQSYDTITLTPYETLRAAQSEFDSQVALDSGRWAVSGYGVITRAEIERVEGGWVNDDGQPVIHAETVAEWHRGTWNLLEDEDASHAV